MQEQQQLLAKYVELVERKRQVSVEACKCGLAAAVSSPVRGRAHQQATQHRQLLLVPSESSWWAKAPAQMTSSSPPPHAQVQQQLQASNVQLAKNNLEQEEVLAELRNQIAIIRCGAWHGPFSILRLEMSFKEDGHL